ncbi:MAG: hypothetical protein Q7R41_15220, partial [Phycisphaerales bacterium]|nr:hypothetical protein [Phycisphaerales bacterium]
MNRLVLTVVLAVVMASSSVFGQSSSLTYQGQLKQAGVPVSGGFSLDFSLWDADVDGNLVAGPVNRPDTLVSNGLFNVLLDFPPEVFSGARLWLEVSVDGIPLTPRQEITPVPYALTVPGLAANDAGVEVSGDVHATGDVIASAFSSNSPLIFKVNPANVECARFDDANCFLGLGTNAPGARLHVGGVAGVDGIMFPDGTLQTTAAGNVVGGDSVWSLAGGGNIFYAQGNVGIGTTAPASKLDIAAVGDGAEVLRLSTERPWVFRQALTGSVTRLQLMPTTGLKNFDIVAPFGTNVATFFADDAGSKVGIGTSAPLSKLDIAAAGDGAELLRFSTERPWVFRQAYSGPGTALRLIPTVGLKNFEIAAAGGTNVA